MSSPREGPAVHHVLLAYGRELRDASRQICAESRALRSRSAEILTRVTSKRNQSQSAVVPTEQSKPGELFFLVNRRL